MTEENDIADGALDSGNVSPCSERSTPPHYLWAKDLRHLLDDYDGYSIFMNFLSLSNSQNELEFWYACNGLKKLQRPKESERIANVAKTLCKDFIHAQGEKRLRCISSAARVEIQRRFAQQNVDENVFDEVQQEVYANLSAKHAEFVVSDTYIAYLQTVQTAGDGAEAATYYVVDDSPNSSRSSTSGDANRPSSSFLPTVQEVDDEVESAISDKMSATSTLRKSQGVGDGSAAATMSRTADCCEMRPTTGNDYCDTMPPEVSGASPSCIASSTTSCDDKTAPHRKQRSSMPASASSSSSSSSKRNVANATNIRGDNDFSSSKCINSSWLPPNLHNIASGGSDRKKTDSKLTPNALIQTSGHRNRSTMHVAQPGFPPNPYHTQTSNRPYVPHLTTSAQDSELASMSSDAATESSVSGANFRHHSERHIMKYAKQNVENQEVVPRTQRSIDSQPHDMMNERFRSQVLEKLERLRKQNNMTEKLHVTLQTLADPDDANSSRAALKNLFTIKEQQPPENDCGSILDDHFIRIGWQDTPPLRSPGFNGRRRSPGSKSPDRLHYNKIMTASYPVAFPSTSQQLTPYQQGVMGRHPQPDPSFNVHFTQSAYLPQQQQFLNSPKHRGIGGVGAPYSASNTLHRHSKTSTDVHSSADVEKQRLSSAPTRTKFPSAHPSVFSDTSGISSSVSTDVSSDPRFFDQNTASSGAKPKFRSAGTMPLGANTATKVQKSSGAHSAMPKSTSSNEKTKTAKTNATDGGSSGGGGYNTQQYFKKPNVASGGRRPTTNDMQMQSPGQECISIVYVLPNEPTPFRTKFSGSKMTLKQFKGLLAKRQSNFKYFFKSRSSEEDSEFWQEVLNDTDEVPFQEYGKINARVDAPE